ncbi:protein disulfide isomerase pTAC5, chloroplastic isoform X2 [Rosa chinensis]|uniref:protein disulfide isomerase pTAC5, chloroplastic isoform X2 n=1 Tax=Rosa chinensis TaxID=74649 RepID=UPI001AD8E3C6|nr:protein disulfide isomerase pTAC5, chloroplastic isoform X2 [Rosa chinensis]
MSSSSLTLFLHPHPPRLNHLKPHLYSLSPLTSSLSFKPHICFSSNSNSNHDATSEESRWLREEQRWLREEQRWLREEQRWARDRDSLLREIADLKLKLQALELQNPLQAGASSETIANIAGLLQSLKEKNQIAETGSSSRALELEDHNQVKEVFAVSEVRKEKKTKEVLRKGSEGEHVRAMQEALLKSGFYSGEEDMEFSNFSSGTERAVKTWQASIGLPEDGIMTEELLERLFDPQTEGAVETKEDANGAAGENRWEEPSRLNKKKGSETNTTGTTTTCLTCRGEGRLLCTECDGTGEPNVEEQFLEWIDEGAKCPYCEGLGFTACDVCGGK